MSCVLTAYSVKIIAPGEAAIKTAIAREALYEWNGHRAWDEARAFLPLICESGADSGSPVEADLVVAFFRASTRTQGLTAEAESVVQRHGRAGRPVLIYLCEGRTDLNEASFDPAGLRSVVPDVLIDSFKDEKEFRAKFTQQLSLLVRDHPHFKSQAKEAAAPPYLPTAPPTYSKYAESLLIDACDDPEAYIARMKDSRGLKIQVNGRQLVEAGNPDSAAQWGAAFDELLRDGLLHDVGCNGQLFQISAKGFRYLETLGKVPVGYIAELGGM